MHMFENIFHYVIVKFYPKLDKKSHAEYVNRACRYPGARQECTLIATTDWRFGVIVDSAELPKQCTLNLKHQWVFLDPMNPVVEEW